MGGGGARPAACTRSQRRPGGGTRARRPGPAQSGGLRAMAPPAPAARRPRSPGRPRAAPGSPRSRGPRGRARGPGSKRARAPRRGHTGGQRRGRAGEQGGDGWNCPNPELGSGSLQTRLGFLCADVETQALQPDLRDFSGVLSRRSPGGSDDFHGRAGTPSSHASETKNWADPRPAPCWVPGGVREGRACACRERTQRGLAASRRHCGQNL